MVCGPWSGTGVDQDFAANARWFFGDVEEAEVYDDEEHAQGCVVFTVLGSGGKARLFRCLVHAVEDDGYQQWLLEDKKFPNPGIYRVCQGKGDDREKHFKGKPILLFGAGVFRIGMRPLWSSTRYVG